MEAHLRAFFSTAAEWIEQIRGPELTDEMVYKRGPYRQHKDKGKELQWVFQGLAGGTCEVPRGGIAALSKATGIPDSTLDTWKRRLADDPSWRPTRKAYVYRKRIFSDFEEDLLLEQINKNFLSKGYYYSDQDFKLDALRFYQSRIAQREQQALLGSLSHPPNPVETRRFICSAKFVQGFRKRHRLSLRRPRFKRRTRVTEAQIQEFIERTTEIMTHYPRNRIINLDETNWKAVAAGFLTWAAKGTESVHCHIDNDEKEGVTVIAAIDAAGNKLPLTIIGKGRTKRCLAGFHTPDEIWETFSESGWTTSEIMCGYLLQLRKKLFQEGPLLVILDTYAAHRSREVRAIAELCCIDLIFIPPGCTDRTQPLDRRVFGVLKAHAREIWRKFSHAHAEEKVTREMMASRLIDAWNRVTQETIDSAWEIFDEGWESGRPNDDEDRAMDDGEYRQLISLHDVIDL
jgi:hypothetical protein